LVLDETRRRRCLLLLLLRSLLPLLLRRYRRRRSATMLLFLLCALLIKSWHVIKRTLRAASSESEGVASPPSNGESKTKRFEMVQQNEQADLLMRGFATEGRI